MTENINEDNEVRFTVRMDAQLYELLKQSAKISRRSVAKELEAIVDFHLSEKELSVPEELLLEFAKFLRKNPKLLSSEKLNSSSKVNFKL